MGLKATIQKAVTGGLKALGDLQETITYQAAGAPTYNATTGAPSVPNTNYSVPATFVRYRKDEIDGETVKPEDQKALIGAQNLPVTPTLNDTILRGSEAWVVMGAKIDPAGALWVLQIRRP